jgi:hypothetical protein
MHIDVNLEVVISLQKSTKKTLVYKKERIIKPSGIVSYLV